MSRHIKIRYYLSKIVKIHAKSQKIAASALRADSTLSPTLVSSNKMCEALEKFALELQNAEINGFAIMKFDNLRVVAKVCSGKVLTDFISVAGVAYLQESKQVWLELKMLLFCFSKSSTRWRTSPFLAGFLTGQYLVKINTNI